MPTKSDNRASDGPGLRAPGSGSSDSKPVTADSTQHRSSRPGARRLFGPLAREGVVAGLRQARWLLTIIVPVSFAVLLLRQLGALDAVSAALSPLFSIVGLSGVGAMAFVAGVISSPYTVVAIIGTVDFAVREIAILSVMSLIAHNFPVELAIMKRTGTGVVRMFVVRLTAALAAGFALQAWLPAGLEPAGGAGGSFAAGSAGTDAAGESLGAAAEALPTSPFGEALAEWAISTLRLAAIIVLILCALMVAVRLLRAYGVIDLLARVLQPLMRAFGLPRETAFLWLVCNLMGLTYGAAVVLEEERSGRLTPDDGDLLNHHIGISHSIFEDTMIFLAVGAPFVWITMPRVVLAAAAVWLRRAERIAGRHLRAHR